MKIYSGWYNVGVDQLEDQPRAFCPAWYQGRPFLKRKSPGVYPSFDGGGGFMILAIQVFQKQKAPGVYPSMTAAGALYCCG